MANIILGAADLYDWDDIRPWVLSAKPHGDIWLVLYRTKGPRDILLKHLADHGINVYEVHHDPYMHPIQHEQRGSPTQSHSLRFYHFWELLTRLAGDDLVKLNEYAVITDVKDVIFQSNPFPWIDAHTSNSLIGSSEGIQYKDEEWGLNNLLQGFGNVYTDLIGKHRTIYNVGVLAGMVFNLKGLCHTIFRMTEQRYYPSDQSSFNVLIQQNMLDISLFGMGDNWAAQLGTTLDPTKSWLWDRLIEPRPVIKNGEVFTAYGEQFVLVHQWDRVPELKQLILDKYK